MILSTTGSQSPSSISRPMSAMALLTLLPVLGMVALDMLLVYYQYAPSSSVSPTIAAHPDLLMNLTWLVDKYVWMGTLGLLAVVLYQVAFVQCVSKLLVAAMGLMVHIASLFIVQPSVVTPFLATHALSVFPQG